MPYWAQAPYGSCSDSTEYQLMTVEANDAQSISTLVGQGSQVMASIGGWNFPSAYFSQMVASSESRQKFISSAKSFLQSHGMKGIDIDWEYPCSAPREDPVKITCDKFRTTQDAGGNCPADKNNLVLFLKEVRQGLGDEVHISVASQAGKKNWENMNLVEASPYVDHWNVMNYDYMVPDIADGAPMSPNAPLYTPSAPNTVQMSIDYTIQGYLTAGVEASKIMVGIPFYGHTWFSPGMSSWQKFGASGSVQGQCCGPFKSTYGAKPGKACSQCGVMMYSEILAAGCDTTFDDETKSDIMYCASAGKDGYTEAGTWITYASKQSIAAITQYALDKGLAGVFVFDTSMDTVSGGQFTFELMNQIADHLDAPPTPPAPSPPAPSPTPTPEGGYSCVSGVCTSVASGGVAKDVCDQLCVSSYFKCTDNQCVPSSSGVSQEVCEAVCGSNLV